MVSIAGAGIAAVFRPPARPLSRDGLFSSYLFPIFADLTVQRVVNGFSGIKLVSLSEQKKSFQSVRLQTAPKRFNITCAAKPATVDKVCEIVKKQLSLPDGTSVSGESTFSALGADSLDTVEIVMGLEEAFGIVVEEDSAQSISTVQDAADLIEKLVEAK
ncbi:Acyl carrier protein 1, chloroplastic [Apostasia shenzhenica]|uniref:Acyl carrier protein n=1 Tax=Apostasia shenzhenica TaxID=1088818 RepID=A0A2I0B391_9ASPA|nr:Acyl carrier protein 1, chloroplastic [Apostasia shenzhenica]